ncbi:adenosylcobinamide-phosphate synthase CbiB [Enhydrobacter sp.]|jgi:adenosylcobinamide-phosphate synthase|uniref:adenosylcobinamide-phosphate synthase CbiB n=1 Tax=Enhydrobacter sp. TaxID=1894999 RepID=UPI00261BFE1E|nr:adenosylcobinamide-phosphate synthase CbiB [Enhydrobacter sp.]WIM10316.1 MAG: Adenosylcobinamide-phosphate synthase [Enhydrobacter sp.]
MFVGLALLAAAIEAAVGYPDRLFRAIRHPVTWIARVITWGDRTWNSAGDSDLQQRLQGVALLLLLVAGSLLTGLLISALLHLVLPAIVAFVVLAVLASTLLAQRSLDSHVAAVAEALEGKGLAAARAAVAMIVGRDTKDLDEAGISRAAIESLAESFSDGVVAPLLWMAVAGLPGALAYKAINTADSMIGHKTPRHLHFGWAAARADDLVNLPASRLAALWLALAALLRPGLSARQACMAAWQDAGRHDSPNAGWPEAAMAGALGVRLMGPRSYDGERVDGPWLGRGRTIATARDIRSALSLYRTACGLQMAVLLLVLLALILTM